MYRQAGIFCTNLLLLLLCLPAAAQNGKVKTRVERTSSNHTTIVIHDTRPEAYTRQRDVAIRAQQAREADAQRKHEIELAKIQADAQVRVARAQNMVAQAPAPAPVRREEQRPSYRNGGRFTGFSDVFIGGFGGYGFGWGGGFNGVNNCRPFVPARCAPVARGCR
jgi:hypothetical protein